MIPIAGKGCVPVPAGKGKGKGGSTAGAGGGGKTVRKVVAVLNASLLVLEDSCLRGDVASVERILSDNPTIDINWAGGEDGWAPLASAAGAGHLAVVDRLLRDDRIEVNVATPQGYTPLHLAALQGHVPVIRRLLADPRIIPDPLLDTGDTPIHIACNIGWVAAVEALWEDPRIDPDPLRLDGHNPFFLAAQAGHLDIVRTYLARPGMRYHTLGGSDGLGAIHAAVCDGRTAVVRELLMDGRFDPNARSRDQWTPLHVAASVITGVDTTPSLDLLLAHPDIDPNPREEQGLTPLHVAVIDGKATVLQRLLEDGRVDPNIPNEKGQHPLQTAVGKGDGSLAALLACPRTLLHAEEGGVQFTLLHAAVRAESTAAVKTLLADVRIDPNALDAEGVTPLILAIKGRAQTKSILALLLAHPSLDPNSCDLKGASPLHYAPALGNTAAVQWLLAHPRIEVNPRDYKGLSPLDVANEVAQTPRSGSEDQLATADRLRAAGREIQDALVAAAAAAAATAAATAMD